MVRAEARPEGEESLADLVIGTARRLRRQSMEALAPHDVTPSQSRALGVLARHRVMRPGELSEHLRIAPRSGTEVIDGLEARGLVRRDPDPDDRRATLVSLTPEGEQLGNTLKAARSAAGERLFGALSEQDQQTLARILRDLG